MALLLLPILVSLLSHLRDRLRCSTPLGALDKVEVVNRLRKSDVLDTIRNYTTNYDTTWIFDKIQ